MLMITVHLNLLCILVQYNALVILLKEDTALCLNIHKRPTLFMLHVHDVELVQLVFSFEHPKRPSDVQVISLPQYGFGGSTPV